MTESRMVSADEAAFDAPAVAQPEPDFHARVMESSRSIFITAGAGGIGIGSLLLQDFGIPGAVDYWKARLARALNNGRKVEQMQTRMLIRGQPVKSSAPKIDVREFVKTLDKRTHGGKDGASIRGEQKSADR